MTSIIDLNYQKQFLEYCKEGKFEEIKQILSEHQTNIDIHSDSEEAFRLACTNGRLEVVKYLLSLDPTMYRKINIHAWNEYAFRFTCSNGHIEIVKYLLSLDQTIYGKIDIHACIDSAFCYACEYGHIEIIKYLSFLDQNIYGKIDIHACTDSAFRYACINGRLEVVKYLLSLDHNIYGQINIHIQDDYAFRYACIYGQLETVKYLCEICKEYSYKIIDDKIIPIIKLFDISDLQIVDIKEKVQCLICGERGETDNIINLNCKNGNTSLLHCYCVACFEEIYERYEKCSYCMQPINKTNIQKVNIISSE